MQVRISPESGMPIYLQIVNQVKYLVASGRLTPGDELPPIRSLAEQLLINPNTVARAYRELEVAGLLTKRQGAGTYVSDGGSPLARKERLRIIGERVDSLVAEAHNLGIDMDDVVEMIKCRNGGLGGSRREDNS